ncbi:hypothetical protein JIN84_05880 [Luteolibacter yonseiensis]|uniref:Uncharacterized protein n=1 Tax=Luteolibacter yonseiensis TaxID=1144680 RepID=A0A934R2K8_9BACT|nr:hypothetical protein [Luteolibacter yonseiensis]MBK1815131.1 hypothetical protein [Luteolibacter yonseiensis]
MATYQTDTAKLQAPGGAGDSGRAPGGLVSADVLMLTATYTLRGDETTADSIEIGTAPAGSRLVPHLCRVVSEAVGGSFAGSIGDAADATRYSTALTLSSAATLAFAGAQSGALSPVLNTANTPILFKVTGAPAASLASKDKKVTFLLAFTAQN